MPFVPLSRIAQYFECDYSVVSDDMYQKEIALSISKQSEAYKAAAFVNEKGYESDTFCGLNVEKVLVKESEL